MYAIWVLCNVHLTPDAIPNLLFTRTLIITKLMKGQAGTRPVIDVINVVVISLYLESHGSNWPSFACYLAVYTLTKGIAITSQPPLRP